MPGKDTPKLGSERLCARCATVFFTVATNHRYCTTDCSRAARREYLAAYMRAQRQGNSIATRPHRNRVEVTCETCNTAVSRYASHAARGGRPFCSQACYNVAQIKTGPKPTGTCIVCGNTFEAEQYLIDKGRQFCGRACTGRYRSDHNALDRLHHKTVRLSNGCLVRTVRLMPSGYSGISWRGKHVGAHVLAYMLANGVETIDKGIDVTHNCPGGDNKACIEPSHLTLKTHAKNIQDASQRGSIPRKLDPDKVRAMRLEWSEGGLTMKALAAKYGVTDMAARSAILRETWAWVE